MVSDVSYVSRWPLRLWNFEKHYQYIGGSGAVLNNNRGHHQEVMFVTTRAARANRDVSRASIGTKLIDPNINCAGMAKSYGMKGIGPITDPNDIGPAIQRAIQIAKRGEPVMVDTVTEGRG